MKKWLIGTLVFCNVVLAQRPTPLLVDSLHDIEWLADPDVRADLKEHDVTVLVFFPGHPDRRPLGKVTDGTTARPTADGYQWSSEAAAVLAWAIPQLRSEGFKVVRYYHPQFGAEAGISADKQIDEIVGYGLDGIYFDGTLPLAGTVPDAQARRIARVYVQQIRERAPPPFVLMVHDSIVPGVGRRVTWQPHSDIADYCRTGELPYLEGREAGVYLEDRFGPPAPIPQTDDDPLWDAIYATAGCTMIYKPDPKGGPLKHPYHLPVEARCRQWKIAREHGHTDFLSRSWFGPWKECMEGTE